jgi:broad specificity phosphatase PhoE
MYLLPLLPLLQSLPIHEQTGTSDIPLTERGLQRVTDLGKEIVGEGSEFTASQPD